MCLRCAVDEGTENGYCRECGCLIGLYQGEPMCTPDECWCLKQPDVGDWHALREDVPEPVPDGRSPEERVQAWLDCFDDEVRHLTAEMLREAIEMVEKGASGSWRASPDLPQPQGGAGAEEATDGQAEPAHTVEGLSVVQPLQAPGERRHRAHPVQGAEEAGHQAPLQP